MKAVVLEGKVSGSSVLRPVQGKQDPKDHFAHLKLLGALVWGTYNELGPTVICSHGGFVF